MCPKNDIGHEDVDRVEAVVNWLETQYPSPAFPTRREDLDVELRPGSTRFEPDAALRTADHDLHQGWKELHEAAPVNPADRLVQLTLRV